VTTSATAFVSFGISLAGPTNGQTVDVTLRIQNPVISQTYNPSHTNQGYAKWFFDRVQVGNTIYWDRYDSTKPPPPVLNGSAFSVIEARHFAWILGSGSPSNNMNLRSLSVWQASTDNNIGADAYLGADGQLPYFLPTNLFIPVATPDKGAFVDNQGHAWSITSGGVVMIDGVPDKTTNRVVLMLYNKISGAVYHQMVSGDWWSMVTPFMAGTWKYHGAIHPLEAPGITIAGLAPGTSYDIEVGAINSGGYGQFAVASGTTNG
jgi:hypothetical protein